jgi:hypothetical protein
MKSYYTSCFVLLCSLAAGGFFYLGHYFFILSFFFILLMLYFLTTNDRIRKTKKEKFIYELAAICSRLFLFLGIIFSTPNNIFSYAALLSILLRNHIKIQYNATIIESRISNKILTPSFWYFLFRHVEIVFLLLLALLQFFNKIFFSSANALTDLFMIFIFWFSILLAIYESANYYMKLRGRQKNVLGR